MRTRTVTGYMMLVVLRRALLTILGGNLVPLIIVEDEDEDTRI